MNTVKTDTQARAEYRAELARKREENRVWEERAARALGRAGSVTFPNTPKGVRKALEFFYERQQLMPGANAMYPQVHTDEHGRGHRVVVDGGPRADVDEVHATLVTIAQALADLPLMMANDCAGPGRPMAIPPEHAASVIRSYYGGHPGLYPPITRYGQRGPDQDGKGARWAWQDIARFYSRGGGETASRRAVYRYLDKAEGLLRVVLVEGGVLGC